MSENRKYFEPLPMFQTTLTHALEHHDCLLPIDTINAIKLCDNLGTECYSYLVISDGCDREIVKVEEVKGHLILTRGLCETYKRGWPCGTRIEFHMIKWALYDMINQAVPKPPEEDTEICGLNEVLCIGRWNYTFENGLLVKKECNNNRIPNDYVDNPMLRFDENGCLIEAGEGANRTALNRHY